MGNADTVRAADRAVAIIGMAGRFPGASHVGQLWANLRAGAESIASFSDEELAASGVDPALIAHPDYVKAKGVLADIESFDASLFGFNPREAAITDPQQRLFLECAWEALEVAGYLGDTRGAVVGVYAGSSMSTYLLANILPDPEAIESAGHFQVVIGNDKDFLPARVSYKLNLTGPSVAVQTACSSSLVAVHMACQSLLNGECDMALAGGASVLVPHRAGYLYRKNGVVSPDGHCRAFDAGARGSVSGSGVGVVVVKRLADALADRDSIDAVILATAVNNDGSSKAGFWAPSAAGQAAVIAEAHALAGVDPETITYVEAHGTGTTLGDPVEIAALTEAFRLGTRATQFCAVGSIKTNIGHLESAAGVAGLIKTVLAVKHRELPPSLHFREANPRIQLVDSPFYVNTSLAEWRSNGDPLRAAVSSLGIGGTNAHVVLEEAPAAPPPAPSRQWQLLLLSAATEHALDAATDALAAHLNRGDQRLADIAYTCAVGRKSFPRRRALVCRDVDDAKQVLTARDPGRVLSGVAERGRCPVTFLFPGLGDHYVNMGRGLYESLPVFRAEIERCADLLKPHIGLDVRDVLYASSADSDAVRALAGPAAPALDLRRLLGRAPDRAAREELNRTDIAQPALFAVEYALAKAWMHIGVTPDAMVGYSIGEYVAACLAGVFSLEDALRVVARRAQWIQQLPPGAMLAVPLAESELMPLLGPQLSVATVNAPSVCVVSGPVDEVSALEASLADRRLACRRVETSHAFHSAQLQPIVEPLVELLHGVALNPPAIPFVSNLTGTWIAAREATDPRYWAGQMTGTVRFSDAVGAAAALGGVRLEVGPGHGLSTLALQHPAVAAQSTCLVAASLRHDYDPQPDLALWLKTVGKLWMCGVAVDWKRFYEDERRCRVPLPTYPFDRQRYWIEPPRRTSAHHVVAAERQPARELRTLSWTRSVFPPATDRKRSWLILADHHGVGAGLARELERAGHGIVSVRAGCRFGAQDARTITMDPLEDAHYRLLLAELARRDRHPDAIVHLWSIAPDEDTAAARRGLHSLLHLVRAWNRDAHAGATDLWIVTNNLQLVESRDTAHADKASLAGACLVIPHEYPGVTCRMVDTVLRCDGPGDEVVQSLVADLCGASTETIVAHRGRHRWVRARGAIDLRDLCGPWCTADGRGAWLIVADAERTSLDIAEWAAAHTSADLVLALWSRRPGPEVHGEAGERRARVAALAASGRRVLLLGGGDGSSWLASAARDARDRVGPIKCVVCLDRLSELPPRPIQDTRAADLHAQIEEARERFRALDEAVAAVEPACCFVLTSDFARGGPGLLAHASAAALWNALVESRGAPATCRWMAIERGEPARAPTSGGTHIRSLPTPYVAPRTDVETALARIWSESLGLESVGVHDGFFELGGHSLMGTQMLLRLREAFGVEVPLRALFESPTVAELAGVVMEKILSEVEQLPESLAADGPR